ncbi:MAG: hypothetical protein IJD51_06610 [Clostridia bacterium]|nr:hypothetical protein [Clostridia bacterium]
MKKIISMALALMLVVGMVFMLASCSGISNGTYLVAGDEEVEGASIEVKGDKMILKLEQEMMGYEIVASVTVTYVIDGDKITTTYESCEIGGADIPQTVKDIIISGIEEGFAEPQVASFEETENGFKMDGVEYVKQ